MAQDQPKWNQTGEFKALQDKWYEKLKRNGFKDIEQGEEYGRMLLPFNSERFATNKEYNRDKEQYYRLAGQFLHSYKFKNHTEMRIWELHSQGVSVRNIAKKMPKMIDQDLPKHVKSGWPTRINKVQETIRTLANLMLSEKSDE